MKTVKDNKHYVASLFGCLSVYSGRAQELIIKIERIRDELHEEKLTKSETERAKATEQRLIEEYHSIMDNMGKVISDLSKFSNKKKNLNEIY